MKNYLANYLANNSSSYLRCLTGHNLKKILSTVYNAAKSQRFHGNTATFWVADADNNEVIYQGEICDKGTFYIIKNKVQIR